MIEEDAKTLWCGNLSEQVNEELLYELFLQAGPLEKVRIPRERDGRQRNFAFITFCHEVSVPYAISLMQGTALFNRTLALQCRNQTVPLPPPIRSASDQTIEFAAPLNMRNQFEEMTDNFMRQHSFPPDNGEQDRLSVASLQGNWSHRHHPYRKEEWERGRGGGRHGAREEHARGGEGGGRKRRAGARDLHPWEGRRDTGDRQRHYGANSNRRNR